MNATISTQEHVREPAVWTGSVPNSSKIEGLKRRQVKSFDLQPGQTCELLGLAGLGWVTMTGDSVDYILEPSNVLRFFGPGLIVIEGVETEELRLQIKIQNED